MERRLARFNIAIQRQNIKKVSNKGGRVDNGRKAFEAGRLHERKLLIAVLQRKRDRAQSL